MYLPIAERFRVLVPEKIVGADVFERIGHMLQVLGKDHSPSPTHISQWEFREGNAICAEGNPLKKPPLDAIDAQILYPQLFGIRHTEPRGRRKR